MNANPIVFSVSAPTRPDKARTAASDEPLNAGDFTADDDEVEAYDAMEVFDLIRHINDPEHPLTLEQVISNAYWPRGSIAFVSIFFLT